MVRPLSPTHRRRSILLQGSLIAALVLAPRADALLFEGTPDWQVVGSGGGSFGYGASPAGDVNGDGFSDVIISWPEDDDGHVYVHLGGPGGLDPSPAWEIHGGPDNHLLGFRVGAAGDVDADGFDDVLVYVLDNVGGQGAAVRLYRGSPGGPLMTPTWTSVGHGLGIDVFMVGTAGDVNGDGFDDVIFGFVDNDGHLADVYHGSPSGLSATPDWTIDVAPFSSDRYAKSAGDVNGDGYADVVLGMVGIGAVRVYFGSPAGLSTTADVELTDPSVDFFGVSAIGVGDVTGDGYADILVGTADWIGTDADFLAELRLHAGGPTGLDPVPVWTKVGEINDWIHLGVGIAGDANGDGFADLVVSNENYFLSPAGSTAGYIEIYLGGSTPSATPDVRIDVPGPEYDWFGFAATTAGDVNGDGYSDLIASDPYYEVLNLGIVLVYHGGKASFLCDNAPFQELTPPSGGGSANYGFAVASLGDIDADGFGDVAIGAYGYTQLLSEQGMVEVVRGSSNGAVDHWVRYGEQADEWFGFSVAGAGDVNGDGFEDLLIGAPLALEEDNAGAGRVDLHYGSAGGIVDPPAWSVNGEAVNEFLGYAVAGGGDVNGDGYADVVVGIPGRSTIETLDGAIELYLGSATGPSATPDAIRVSGLPGAIMGVSVAIAGDVDGDGYDDVVVGASGVTGALEDQGVAVLYRGTSSGIETAASWIVGGSLANAAMGQRVSGAGDVNGDGFADILVAAPTHVSLFGALGRVELYFGGPGGPATVPDQFLENVFGEFGTSLAAIGDVDRDGYDDVAIGAPYQGEDPLGGDNDDRGRVLLYRGGPAGLSYETAFLGTTESELLGTDLASAVDIDGDGYEDLVMGAGGYDVPTLDTGRAHIVRGQCMSAYAPFPVARRFLDGARVPPGGSTGTDAVRLEMLARSAAGRARVYLEWEVVDLAGSVRSGEGFWTDTGDPAGARAMNAGVPIDAVVSGLDPSTEYSWRVRMRSNSPYFPVSPWYSNTGSSFSEMDLVSGDVIVDVDIDVASAPAPHELAPPSPNPFHAATTISFEIAEAANVRLDIFSVDGRRVRTFDAAHRTAGEHAIVWDGRTDGGQRVAAGVYFIRLQTERDAVTRRVTVLR